MRIAVAAAVLLLLTPSARAGAQEAGLLFHLSGQRGVVADHARGNPHPSVVNDVTVIPDGAIGDGFRCPHYTQILAYWAAGNMYAQRGTVSFYWRARDAYGTTPFPIFQASYSDHSSIDMAWMRIDFNGRGFDAFVTDANLVRVRASHTRASLPAPQSWVHFALAWDETYGIRFYIDGQKVGEERFEGVFDAGLDQFGAHGDVIGPQDVATMEQFLRGGDIDEIRVYDRMLHDTHVQRLARRQATVGLQPSTRSLSEPRERRAWDLRHGWNRPDDPPRLLDADAIAIRKVEIQEIVDLKQRSWKATDGIRETTWPSVYNRSRLPGRNDYFPRPDWNGYSGSGAALDIVMPDERWNHLEIAGGAFGALTVTRVASGARSETTRLSARIPRGQERTFHRLDEPLTGGQVRFVNDEQERAIGEVGAYDIAPGRPPAGVAQLRYTVAADASPRYPVLDDLLAYIDGRFMAGERTAAVALPDGAPRRPREPAAAAAAAGRPLPVVHLLVPFEFRIEPPGEYRSRYSYTWENIHGGLDGIALDLPAMKIQSTHGEAAAFNLQVRDPLWPDRTLLDVTFALRPNEPKTLWLDLRDRILPNDRSLHLVLASSAADFGPDVLHGAGVRLIFKDYDAARAEHEVDRFNQVRDNVGHFLEWGSNRKFLKLYERFSCDIRDLLRVNPHHARGRSYWAYLNGEQGWPSFAQATPPAGVPLWAFRQLELVRLYRQFVSWWIDERQIANGEFGGGLSDDSDLTNQWVGAALMGIDPPKLTRSVRTMLDAIYDNGMITDGLNTIMVDDLHTYEEGFNAQAQSMLLEYGHPRTVERMMETARQLHRLTGINERGERQVRSSFFSATQISTDPIWAKSKTEYSYLIFHPAMLLVDYNGHAGIKRLLLELADGLIAHRTRGDDGQWYIPGQIFFPSGRNIPQAQDTWTNTGTLGSATHLLWAAWRWTGDEKYLQPIHDRIDQGKFGILRALNANVIDLLGRRDTWGRFIALVTRLTHHKSQELAEAATGLTMSATDEQTFLDVATNVASASLGASNFYRHVAWQVTGDKRFLEDYYAAQIQAATQRMSMFTEDQWWVDRVNFPSEELQRSRLGGIALVRSATFQGHAVSWRFAAPATAEDLAVLVRRADRRRITILAFNPGTSPVTADATFWDLEFGRWRVTMGADVDGDDAIDRELRSETVDLERTRSLRLTFPAGRDLVLDLELIAPAGDAAAPRPDLGIGREDIAIEEDALRVTVHSLGSIDAPATTVALIGTDGRTIATAPLPAMEAPRDLLPRVREVVVPLARDARGSVAAVQIDPDGRLREITTLNNRVSVR